MQKKHFYYTFANLAISLKNQLMRLKIQIPIFESFFVVFFSKCRRFHDCFLIALFRFRAIPGVMETQLLSPYFRPFRFSFLQPSTKEKLCAKGAEITRLINVAFQRTLATHTRTSLVLSAWSHHRQVPTCCANSRHLPMRTSQINEMTDKESDLLLQQVAHQLVLPY